LPLKWHQWNLIWLFLLDHLKKESLSLNHVLRTLYHVSLNLVARVQQSLMNQPIANTLPWNFSSVNYLIVARFVLHQTIFTATNLKFKNWLQKWRLKLNMLIMMEKASYKMVNLLISSITIEFVDCSKITVEKLSSVTKTQLKTKTWNQLLFWILKKILHLWLKRFLDHFIHCSPTKDSMKLSIMSMRIKKNH